MLDAAYFCLPYNAPLHTFKKKTKIFFTEKFSGSSLFYLYGSKQVSRVMSTPEEKNREHAVYVSG